MEYSRDRLLRGLIKLAGIKGLIYSGLAVGGGLAGLAGYNKANELRGRKMLRQSQGIDPVRSKKESVKALKRAFKMKELELSSLDGGATLTTKSKYVMDPEYQNLVKQLRQARNELNYERANARAMAEPITATPKLTAMAAGAVTLPLLAAGAKAFIKRRLGSK